MERRGDPVRKSREAIGGRKNGCEAKGALTKDVESRKSGVFHWLRTRRVDFRGIPHIPGGSLLGNISLKEREKRNPIR